ncbi:hypothetical protein FACS1894133_5560 [Clostridia bacterium]|nr:hypothetical protein FACS1894133_5560 [Clostridia bacterium]
MSNFIFLLSEGAAAGGADGAAVDPAVAATAGGTMLDTVMSFLPFVILIGIFYLFFIRPERKREKETRAMLENLQVADEVVTTGGIVGRVLAIQQDTVLVETGGDKTRLRVLRSAISENRTAKAKVEELRKEQTAARRKPALTNIADEKNKKNKDGKGAKDSKDTKDAKITKGAKDIKEDRFDKGAK